MSTPVPVAGFILAGGRSSPDGTGQSNSGLARPAPSPTHDGTPQASCRYRPGRRPRMSCRTGSQTWAARRHCHCARSNFVEHNLIVAVDLPLLTLDFLKYFKQRSIRTKHSLTVCNLESGFPLCLGVHKNLKDHLDLHMARGNKSVHGFIRSVQCEFVTAAELRAAGFSQQLFMNINTDDEYRAAQRADKS